MIRCLKVCGSICKKENEFARELRNWYSGISTSWSALPWNNIVFFSPLFRHSRCFGFKFEISTWFLQGEICCTLWLPPIAGSQSGAQKSMFKATWNCRCTNYCTLHSHSSIAEFQRSCQTQWFQSSIRFYLIKGALLKEWLDHCTLNFVWFCPPVRPISKACAREHCRLGNVQDVGLFVETKWGQTKPFQAF